MRLATLLSVILSGAPANSAPPSEPKIKLGLIAPQASDSVSTPWTARLTQGATAGIRRANFGPVLLTEARCEDPECWVEMARAHGVPGIILLNVGIDDDNYQVELVFVDGDSGKSSSLHTETCEVCSVEEASQAITRGVTSARFELLRRLAPTARIVITSEPVGAVVHLDGGYIGTTPFTIEVPPGTVDIEVSKLGYLPTTSRFEAKAKERRAVHLHLARAVVSTPERRRPFGWRIAGGTAVAAGGIGTIAGAVLLGLHGRPYRARCSGPDIDTTGDCRFIYETQTGGAAALGVGLALVIGGALALVLSARKR
ncbi:MAG: PEGA domain-containing protein [Nannocystaceae bacterium]|nr:PEGA domain-containing protein [Nannocystaceae bacterium]